MTDHHAAYRPPPFSCRCGGLAFEWWPWGRLEPIVQVPMTDSPWMLLCYGAVCCRCPQGYTHRTYHHARDTAYSPATGPVSCDVLRQDTGGFLHWIAKAVPTLKPYD